MRQHNRSFLGSLSIVFLLLAFGSGCNKSEPGKPSGTGSEKRTKSNYSIGMSQCNLGEPWRVEMNAQIKAVAEKHSNLKVIFGIFKNDFEIGMILCGGLYLRIHFHTPRFTQVALTHADGVGRFCLFVTAGRGL